MHYIFLQFRAHIKTQFEREISVFNVISDNGNKYDNAFFHKFCELNGMSFRFFWTVAKSTIISFGFAVSCKTTMECSSCFGAEETHVGYDVPTCVQHLTLVQQVNVVAFGAQF